ncbi:ABC transporter permease [Zobellella taiwanensis]|uniref:ABC transporter permease n=1 Tax=Zobellella taiwanensis TaxID=347535 RepID=A0A2P7RE39_9GAMM|nr:sugar ABC transporter permease [Zobellella taiwanensis]PSJ48480.1 ABC transporter permease [Zobellella taiwanensis]
MDHYTKTLTPAQRAKATAKAPGLAGRRKLNHQQRRARVAWVLVAPAMILLAAVAGWPLLRTLFYSLTDAALDAPHEYNFVGLANYLELTDSGAYGVLADPLWWQAVGNTLWFTGVSVSLELVLGMLLALLMNQTFRGQGLVRTAILVPWAIPTIVTAKMWGWMFHDQFGVVNDLLLRVGLIDQPLAWIASPSLSMWAVVMADVWKTTPFMALMLLAALQLIPKDLYEAARVDGANAWVIITRIFAPIMGPSLVTTGLLAFIGAWNEFMFALTFVISSGKRTVPVAIGMFQGASQYELPWGSIMAASVVVTLPIIVLVLIFQKRIVSGLTSGAVKG